MKDQVSKIDEKILQLKQKKEKLQTQQALLFLKESQKILGEKFSSDLAITILSHAWKSSSDHQKKEWETACPQGGEEESKSFRKPTQNSRNKTPPTATENPQS